jgi:radical SAM protein with 4Fe4S-binding SPASM domain
MDCPQSDPTVDSTFFQRLGLNRRRMPIAGSMELTFRCNLRCVHCYLGDHRGSGKPRAELSTAEVKRIFDQMADAGTLWLLLTGGDPLLRPDFQEIYTSAKRKGFILTLFTNGTLLTPAIADFLADLPPHRMEITLYGATRETYERVTGIPGSYERCMRGIDLLLERGLPLNLKAMAMTLTVAEIPAMKAYAESRGVDFRFDPMICNDIDQTQAPFALRLPADEVAKLDSTNPARVQAWREFYQKQSEVVRDERYLFSCGAGINAYHIDPFGQLSICMSARRPSYDLRQGSFQEGWEEFLRQVRFAPAEKSACRQCSLHSLCGICPGWSDSENQNFSKPVEYLCQIGHRRAEVLGITS